MRGRPGRVLPSMIIGGLLVSGLVLGTGVASAAATCTDGATKYDISISKTVEADTSGNCQLKPGVVETVLEVALKALPKAPADTSATTNDTKSSDSPPVATIPVPSSSTKPKAPPNSKHDHGTLGTTLSTGQTGTRNTSAPAVLAAAALPPAAAVAPPLAGLPLAPGLPGLVPAGGFAPTALAGGSLPGGVSSGLFGADFGNPALLAGTPLGAAASSLYQPQADSAVTTVSHSQALATGVPKGVGTPTAIAAVALACVVGLLVRSRVMRRIARRELLAGAPARTAEADADTTEATTDDDLVRTGEPLLAA